MGGKWGFETCSNYYTYHRGNGEIVVGNALRDGYRERVRLATKIPVWLVNSREDMDRYFNEQLKKLQTDYIDFYLLHSLNRKSWSNVKDLNVFEWAERVISEGKIKYLGFSFHDEFDVFKEIIDGYDKCTFCKIQYNYENEDIQFGTKDLKYAAGKGLAAVISEIFTWTGWPTLGNYMVILFLFFITSGVTVMFGFDMDSDKKLDVEKLGARLDEIKELRTKLEELRKDIEAIKKTL